MLGHLSRNCALEGVLNKRTRLTAGLSPCELAQMNVSTIAEQRIGAYRKAEPMRARTSQSLPAMFIDCVVACRGDDGGER